MLFPGAFAPTRLKTSLHAQISQLKVWHRVGNQALAAPVRPNRPVQLALLP